MKKIITIIYYFIILLLFSGCTMRSHKADTKPSIAVSIAPQATFAEKICDENFNIITAIPAGASPEVYEPSPLQVKELADASLYFSVGVPAEEGSILQIIDKEAKVIALQKKVNEKYPDRIVEEGRDPHIWLSPKRAIVMVQEMAEAIKDFDPENAEFYQENSEKYIKELEELDLYIRSVLNDKVHSKFIAFHPAFGYFADDYGLSMYALEEHGKEATAKHMTEIAELAKKEGIKVVFYQAEGSKKQALSFAEQIDGEAVMLEPLASDYTENIKRMTESLLKAMK